MMITFFEKYETQSKLLKERFLPCYIVSPRIGGGDQYDSKDVCTIYKSSWEGKHCNQEDHIK